MYMNISRNIFVSFSFFPTPLTYIFSCVLFSSCEYALLKGIIILISCGAISNYMSKKVGGIRFGMFLSFFGFWLLKFNLVSFGCQRKENNLHDDYMD